MPTKTFRSASSQKGLFDAPRKAGAPPRKSPAANSVSTTAPARKPRAPKARKREDATSMATRQREISVSEFFTKNRHLLGFDNPQKALLTTIKEAVDNSLDACEEAGILPEVRVEIVESGENRYRISVQDNGPGIVRKQIPKIFGKLLYGSKFHRMKQQRGQQGIGISAAGMYAQLTTGQPVEIVSRTGRKQPAHRFRITLDTQKNQPVIQKGGITRMLSDGLAELHTPWLFRTVSSKTYCPARSAKKFGEEDIGLDREVVEPDGMLTTRQS